MLIKQKANDVKLQLGVAYIVIAIILFVTLGSLGSSAKEIMGVGRFFSLILFIFGLANIQKYHQYKQEKELFFDIKNQKIFYKDQEHPLKGYLSVTFKEEDGFYLVSLWDEDRQVFEDVVFDKEEMEEFLALIKPYRKTDICLLENEKSITTSEEKEIKQEEEKKETSSKPKEQKIHDETIRLFDKGLIVENREILYDEIEHLFANINKSNVNGKMYVDIHIELKSGATIHKRLADEDDQAKALYAKLFFETNGKVSKEDYPCPKYNLWSVVVIVILLVVGFSGELGWIAIIITFFLAVFYLSALVDIFYEKSICKRVHTLIEYEQNG